MFSDSPLGKIVTCPDAHHKERHWQRLDILVVITAQGRLLHILGWRPKLLLKPPLRRYLGSLRAQHPHPKGIISLWMKTGWRHPLIQGPKTTKPLVPGAQPAPHGKGRRDGKAHPCLKNLVTHETYVPSLIAHRSHHSFRGVVSDRPRRRGSERWMESTHDVMTILVAGLCILLQINLYESHLPR